LTRRLAVRVAVYAAVPALCLVVTWFVVVRMPLESYTGELPALSSDEAALRDALRSDIEALAGRIGDRSTHAPDGLARAARHVEDRLSEVGYEVRRQTFHAASVECQNLEVELGGAKAPAEIVVIGAHYDSLPATSGADDNASGAAALIVLARAFAGRRPGRTLRFVAFANEEPPHFQTRDMGSVHYARRMRERKETVHAMLSIESIGYYSVAEDSQRYPFPLGLFYPERGDFVAFVGNLSSRELVRHVVESFRRNQRFPSEGAAAPEFVPGVGWSDHWSFWREGYSALMVTDTAPFRNPGYHQAADDVDSLDYERMARVVNGLAAVVRELADM
jgi:hypothetical protein